MKIKILGSLKPTLSQPYSDKRARFNALIWGGLTLVSLLNIALAMFLGGWIATIVVSVIAVATYATFLKWSIQGLAYRSRLAHDKAERETFDQIVAGL